MSLPTAVLGGNFVEWRIFAFGRTMQSPTFLMDDRGMACQVILEAVGTTAQNYELHIRLSNNIGKYAVCFICHINDSYYVRVENENHQSGKYRAHSRVSATLSPRHMYNGKSYMSVKLRCFLHNECPSNMPILPSTLPEKFSWLLESKEFSDLAIETADGSCILVHQVILAMHSPVFHSMLKSGKAEANSQCIEICDFPPETVKQMVTFIYTGQLEDVTYESAAYLLKIADKYDLKHLKQFCARYLLMHLSPWNALELLWLTHTCGEKIVKEKILRFISENRQEFTKPGVFDCLQKADHSLYVEIITTFADNRSEV